jgi:transcription initiation factor TFIIH subunit 1
MIFRLLSENPSLLQLYRDLVMTHVISSEEFWSQHALQYMQKQQNQKQDIGISGAFLVCFFPPDVTYFIFICLAEICKKYFSCSKAKVVNCALW